jgi:D-inositol-3-phosphate glycosyltransferase
MESKAMKLCVISFHSSPLDPVGSGTSGGMSVYLSNICKELSRFCEIDIFTCGKSEVKHITPSLRIVYLPCQNLNHFTDSVIAYHQLRKYDVLHTHYWLSGLVGLLMRKRYKIKWIHTLHTVEMLKHAHKDHARIEAESEIIRSCDLILSPTRKEAFQIETRYPGCCIVTIPHGVDIQKFTPSHNGHARLLFVGRIDPIKGLEVLIDALRMIGKDINLDVVGGPSKGIHTFESIKTYAENLSVRFVGPVPHDKLHEHYQRASVVVVPSYYESFGLVALEAMASARPVIGFEDTGLSETVADDAGVLVQRSEKNLGYVIEHLIGNHELCYQLGMKGREKAIHYRWENISRRYREVYEEISKN